MRLSLLSLIAAVSLAAVGSHAQVPVTTTANYSYYQCAFSPGFGPNSWGAQVSCSGQRFWVADRGNGCASISVNGTGYLPTTDCIANGALLNNASGMCLTCMSDSSSLPTADIAAYCAVVGTPPGKKYTDCCIAVVQERLLGRTVLSSSCSACQDLGVCPETNTKWTDILPNRKLATCRTHGKVGDDTSGTPVTWCRNDSAGIVALIICLVIFFGLLIIGAAIYICRSQQRRRQKMGLGMVNTGVTMQPMGGFVVGQQPMMMASGYPQQPVQGVYGQPQQPMMGYSPAPFGGQQGGMQPIAKSI